MFPGLGDRGVYGFAAASGKGLPNSLLFAFEPATLDLEAERGLGTVVAFSGRPNRDIVALRGNRFGQARAASSIAPIRRLISAATPRDA